MHTAHFPSGGQGSIETVLWRAGFSECVLLSFHKAAFESVLTYPISLWQGMCTVHDRKTLQRVIKTTQKVIKGAYLQSIE